MLKQQLCGHFEPEITRFGPWKRPKCLKNALLCDGTWVTNGLGVTTCPPPRTPYMHDVRILYMFIK